MQGNRRHQRTLPTHAHVGAGTPIVTPVITLITLITAGCIGGPSPSFAGSGPAVRSALIKSKAAWTILKAALASPGTLTHEDLDKLGTPRAVSQVHSLLVEHAVLPERDEYAHRLQTWTADQIAALPHSSDQLALRHFVRWRQQRRTRLAPLTNTTAANDKRELRLILGLITYLNASDQTMSTADQELIDQWVA